MSDHAMNNSESNNQGEWFRASDDVRKRVIQGVPDGPERFAFKSKEVEYSVINGRAIFEGDIFLGNVEEAENLMPAADGVKGIAITSDDVVDSVSRTGRRFRWLLGVVAYEIHVDLPNQQRVHDAIAEIQANTNIRFVERTNSNADRFDNYIQFFEGDGCWSSVGMQGGRQQISLASGCGRGSTVHEILHALGLWHEQSREDRGDNVTINWDNIQDNRDNNFNQHIIDGDDIGSYDFGSIMHYGRFAFSKNGLPTIEPKFDVAIGQRNGMSLGDIAAIRELYPAVLPQGTYTIRQKSNNRYLDAYQSSGKDYSIVTRTSQSNNTQRWTITPVGVVYTMRQLSSNRFVDAHQSSGNDFSAVTRTAQNNDTQRWVFMHFDEDLCTYTIQQFSSGRFMDAHQSSANDFSIVTRTAQNNDTQRWTLNPLGNNRFTIQQKSSGRFMDAHQSSGNDFSLVTRNAQNNDTQRWILTPMCGVYTLQQKSSGRFMDAHQSSTNDYSVVTRAAQHNDTQRWVILPSDHQGYTIQQLSSNRFLDAHTSSANDFSVVTRTAQHNDTQRWKLRLL